MGNKSKRIRVRKRRIAVKKMILAYWEFRLPEKKEIELVWLASLSFSPKKLDQLITSQLYKVLRSLRKEKAKISDTIDIDIAEIIRRSESGEKSSYDEKYDILWFERTRRWFGNE